MTTRATDAITDLDGTIVRDGAEPDAPVVSVSIPSAAISELGIEWFRVCVF
jgi:hypothetical protein